MVSPSEATTNSLQLVPLAFCFNVTHVAYGFHECVLQGLHITWINIRIQIDRYMYIIMYLHTHAYIHVHTHLHLYTHRYEYKSRNAISLELAPRKPRRPRRGSEGPREAQKRFWRGPIEAQKPFRGPREAGWGPEDAQERARRSTKRPRKSQNTHGCWKKLK